MKGVNNMEVNTEYFESLIKKLNSSESEWTEAAELIHRILKEEMQSNNANQNAIKKVRDQFESRRQNSISKAVTKFQKSADLNKIDEQLEQFVWEIFLANKLPQDLINYDFCNQLGVLPQGLLDECAHTLFVADVLNNWKIESLTRDRLSSIFSKVVFDSSSQSGVSNAGNAGEMMVEELLKAAGLKKGESYKAQHKSEAGSATDFVFPYVADFKDQDVEIFLAVQFSTNDRSRMVSGELKPGGKAFIFTANGTRAASMGFEGVGVDIIQTLIASNKKFICNKIALEKYIEKLSIDSQKTKKNGDLYKSTSGALIKLNYFKDYTMTWSEFAKMLNDRFVR